ncbi:MAG: hypothetical protein KDC24_00550 [Saprospiraceae bacterium]|nr:hypothetical protein [Saprospiraceae bacterium]
MSENKPTVKELLTIEMVWWLITAIITIAFLIPIWQNISNYPFWTENVIFIVVFITYARLIFLTRYSFLAHNIRLKFIFIAITVPVVFLLINELNQFQTFLDENGPSSIVGKRPLQEELSMISYIHKQIMFFATASIISAVIMPFTMVVSIWKNHNKGTA